MSDVPGCDIPPSHQRGIGREIASHLHWSVALSILGIFVVAVFAVSSESSFAPALIREIPGWGYNAAMLVLLGLNFIGPEITRWSRLGWGFFRIAVTVFVLYITNAPACAVNVSEIYYPPRRKELRKEKRSSEGRIGDGPAGAGIAGDSEIRSGSISPPWFIPADRGIDG